MDDQVSHFIRRSFVLGVQVATAIVSWYALHTNCDYQHTPVVMNLFVHAVMFSYFAVI